MTHHLPRRPIITLLLSTLLFFCGLAQAQAAPTFTTTAPTYAIKGQSYIYDADATDPTDVSLTYTLTANPSGATVNASTGVVTWTTPTGTGNFTLRACNDANQCVTQSWSVTLSDGPTYMVFSAATIQLWPRFANTKYTIYRMSNDTALHSGTLTTAGRMTFIDLATLYGLDSSTGNLYIVADKPIQILSGFTKNSGGGESTYFSSENNSKVGKIFNGYARKDIMVFCYAAGSATPNISVTDLTDSDDSTTLTAANASLTGTARDVNNAASGTYWIWNLTSFDEDEFRIQPANPSATTNPDCSVLAGVLNGRNDWGALAPSSAPADKGFTYGTRFYAYASIEMTIFASQADTKVSIRNLTSGPLANNNVTFTLNQGTTKSLWTATLFPQMYNGFTQISNDTGFNGEFVEITSDKPITVNTTAMRAVGSYITPTQLFKRSDGKYEGYCYINKAAATTNDIRVYSKDAQNKIQIDTVAGQKNDTTTTFYIGPWTGVSPIVAWQGQTYKYAQAPANYFNAEQVRIIAESPVAVVCGDISGATQLYSFPGYGLGINGHPTITSVPPDTAVAGEPYKPNQVVASDPDGDPLSYTLTDAPTGATISPNSGQVIWTPAVADIGKTFTFTVLVMDDEGNFATRTWTVTVVRCRNGSTRRCYSGSAGCTLQSTGFYTCVGTCRNGTQTCSGNTWPSTCSSEVLPATESCDGQDNNCDGSTDNGLSAPNCTKQSGVCAGAKQTCTGAGGWQDCNDAAYTAHNSDYQTTETRCDGKDNDCDGQVDNGLNAPNCTKQSGVCAGSKQTCTGAGGWQDCTTAAYTANNADYEASETRCDGKDNDCDGQIDNNLPAPNCTKQAGVCSGAKQTCTGAGGWQDCTNAAYTAHNSDYETTETRCDGKDNDCDGQVDNGLSAPNCTKQAGVCAGAKQTCDGANGWKDCDNAAYTANNSDYEATETRCDGKDNNCDGQVDNGLSAPNCTKQSGVCAGAKQTCAGTGGWQDCDAAAYAANNSDYEINETKCDGKDNDCDGQVDESLTAPNCTKQSGVCAGAKQTCTGAGGWQDCNDAAYTANNSDYTPTETNSNCDGKDNDCDGQTDEGCNCVDGQTQACYSGGSGCVRQSNGSYTCTSPCKAGTQTCAQGQWGTCNGDTTETTESCNGIDDDCDGQIDNGLTAPNCTKQSGVCAGSKQTCTGTGGWKDCDAAAYLVNNADYQTTETRCDGKDNDCDGQIDNGLTAPNCTKQSGVCAGAKQTCTGAGGWQDCNDAAYTANNADYEATETRCDGKDNNCDGQVDNGLTAPNCTRQAGVCAGAKQTCTGSGGWKDCDAAAYTANNSDYEATESKCDGKDNDCDGQVDEGLNAPNCTKQSGVCAGAKQTCTGTGGWKDCDAAAYTGNNADYEATESKCDGKDNDCDGQIDNGLSAPNCTKQVGVCAGAKQTCDGANGWKDCNNAAYTSHSSDYEVTETKCDGKDNDCDGQIDESLSAPNCTKQDGVCAGSKQTCTGTGGWKDCDTAAYQSHSADYTATETDSQCDGKDNDCDGQVDEVCQCKDGDTQACYTGGSGCTRQSDGSYTCVGECKAGSQTCAQGKWGTCNNDATESNETCDGKDNDCNGQVDDNLTAPNCTKQDGVCAGAKQSCDGANGWKACDAAAYTANNSDYEATESKCDGKDNDCDGNIDNNLTPPNCSKQAGVCAGGKQSCGGTNGWQDCNVADYEATETKCDGKDNDCDGQVDNGLTAPDCSRQDGVCAGAKQICDGANGWKDCNAQGYEPTEDTCDGKDNDCDGSVDEAPKCASSIPPQIDGVPEKFATATKPYGYKPKVVDPDTNDTHTWKGTKLPTGATVDPQTGEVKWTPAAGDVGKEFEFEIQVCDSANLCATQTWKVRVGTSNNLPQIIGTPKQYAKTGQPYGYKPSVRDPDTNDTHTWKGTKLPTGATIDPQTGEVKWTPAVGDEGKEFEFEIEVCDSAGDCATQSWKVRVDDTANTPPVISSTPGTTTTAGTAYNYKPTVTDPDTGDTHTWKLNNGPSGATVDPNTGELKWNPAPGDDGKEFDFEIEVCDDATPPACATQTWKIRVGTGNGPPVIAGTPDTTSTVKVPYNFKPTVNDPDSGDTHTWKGTKLPTGATIDPKTGELNWTPDPADTGKTVEFEIEVCDSATPPACSKLKWSVKVNGTTNSPPVIVGAPSNDAHKDEPYSYKPTVNDPDIGDSHTWKLKNGPSGATVDPNTGELKWTPGAADVGKDFEVEVEVCDSAGACSSRKWKVRVYDANNPPQMEGTPKTWANPSQPYTFEPSVKDPDPNETYTWTGNKLPPGATVDPKTGKITWTPDPADAGKIFDFELELCDSKGLCTKRKWQVRVTTTPRNTPPIISSTPTKNAEENIAYNYKPTVEDPDVGDVHTWKLKKGPSGATVDPQTGEVKWTPGPNDTGRTTEFEIEVCDSQNACDTQTWALKSQQANRPPTITSTPPTVGYVGKPYEYNPTVDDPNPKDKHTWKLNKGPSGATIDPQTGKITWTPSAGEADQPADFEIEVCDDATPPACTTQTWTVTPRNNCTVDIDCKTPQICIPDADDKLVCVSPQCVETSNKCSQQDQQCKHGACIPDPCTGKQCASGEFCRPSDDKCVKPCAGVTCQADQSCIDGACVDGPCKKAGLTCKSDERCDNSDTQNPKCVANPCNNQSCREGRVCQDSGRCQEDPCHKITCPDPSNQRCVNGQCVDRQPCKVDVDCPDDEVCTNGKCYIAGCYTKTPQCPQGERCQESSCSKDECPTPGGNACASGEFCRSKDQKCVKSCGGVSCKEGEVCEDGACKADPCAGKTCAADEVCVNGTCEKNNCDPAKNNCKHGRICSKRLNGCEDDPCGGVTCPAQDQTCVEGQCIKPDCTFDEDCNGTNLCVERKCTARGCVKDSDCADKELCKDGKCLANPCADKTCAAGEFCKNGVCVGTCAGIFCPDGQTCVNGACQADPCASKTCGDKETCVNGTCTADPCKDGKQLCEVGRVCRPNGCIDDPCQSVTCPAGQTCQNGQCTGDRTCQVDVDCPGDAVCVNKVCAKPGCYKDQSCQSAQLCQNASCKDNPCNSKTCNAGEYCDPSDGLCKKSCPSCLNGKICKSGSCVDDPCTGKTCADGETCTDGNCFKDVCADTATQHCRYGRVCKENACRDDSCAGVTCPAGQTCRNGTCSGGEPSTEPTPDAGSPDLPNLIVSGGCGCNTQNSPQGAFWLLTFLLALLALRRRHSSPQN